MRAKCKGTNSVTMRAANGWRIAKREAVLKALSTETDPKMQRRLQASARRYKAMLSMGPERTKAGAGHSRYANRTEGPHV